MSTRNLCWFGLKTKTGDLDHGIEKNCHEKGFGPTRGTENRPRADTERESGVGEAAAAKSGRNHYPAALGHRTGGTRGGAEEDIDARIQTLVAKDCGTCRVGRASLKLKSASCQIGYWEGGKLQIANYLTRRTFSANPATFDVIRF